MAIIRKRDLNSLGKEELENRLKDLKFEKLKLKAQKGQASGATVKSKELRRTIARIHTRLNQIINQTNAQKQQFLARRKPKVFVRNKI